MEPKIRGEYNTKDCKRVDSCKIENVIIVSVLRGDGTREDPARTIKKYFSLEGKYLFEADPCD